MNAPIKSAVDQVSKEKLMDDLRVVVADAEALLHATAGQTGDKIASIRSKVGESLHVAKARLAEAQESVVAQAKVAAKSTDEYVHENPWKAVGIAAAVGLVVGALISRR